MLAIDDQGMTIAAGDGAILAKRVRGGDGKKVAAGEWAKSAGVNAGDSFEKPAAPKADALNSQEHLARVAQEGRPWP